MKGEKTQSQDTKHKKERNTKMARFKVTINEVTSWEEGNESAADWSHGVPTSQIKRAMADEYEEKVKTFILIQFISLTERYHECFAYSQ